MASPNIMQMCSLEPWRKIMHTVLVMHIAISRRRVRRKKYIDDNEVTIFFIYTDVLASSSLQRFWFLQSRYTVEQQLMFHLLIYVCAQFFSFPSHFLFSLCHPLFFLSSYHPFAFFLSSYSLLPSNIFHNSSFIPSLPFSSLSFSTLSTSIS